MSTTPLTIHLDPMLYQRAREQAHLENRTLEQVVERMLRKWVESRVAPSGQYIVRAGDTLAQIALKLYGDAKRYVVLAQANGITDPRLLRVGQTLRVPPLDSLPSTPPAKPEPEPLVAPKPKLQIEYIQSPHYNERPPDARIWAIVIHATASSTLTGVINWFTNPQSQVSAHYNIGKDGRIVQMARDEQRAWHAGKSAWKGVLDVNDFSLGIELVNKNDGIDPYPEAQYRVLVALCKKLVAEYGIKVEDIMGHKDISLSGKTDPAGFDLDRLRQDVDASA